MYYNKVALLGMIHMGSTHIEESNTRKVYFIVWNKKITSSLLSEAKLIS